MGICGHSALIKLGLSIWEIGPAKALSGALRPHAMLHTLTLSSNSSGRRGSVALAAWIGGHGALEELRLSGCKIDQAGAKALCDALRPHAKLR